MKHQSLARLSAAVTIVALLSACSDPATAPARAPLSVAPVAYISGGPDTTDFKNFSGEVWACPDVPYPAVGFLYRWSIVDNATTLVVASGVSTNITGGVCTLLYTGPALGHYDYTAWVREDPAAKFKITSITATYGMNLPIAPPPATLDMNGKAISDMITNDYGVLFRFNH
ncbi:MAG: hypothetical protein ABI910_17610 [Gemmatimonadota bacterium]